MLASFTTSDCCQGTMVIYGRPSWGEDLGCVLCITTSGSTVLWLTDDGRMWMGHYVAKFIDGSQRLVPAEDPGGDT